jgi:hypothetical protein
VKFRNVKWWAIPPKNKQNKNQGALCLKKRTKHENSTHTKQVNIPARPMRIGNNGITATVNRRFVPGSSPATVNIALWIKLPGMVNQMVVVEPGTVHGSFGIGGWTGHL